MFSLPGCESFDKSFPLSSDSKIKKLMFIIFVKPLKMQMTAYLWLFFCNLYRHWRWITCSATDLSVSSSLRTMPFIFDIWFILICNKLQTFVCGQNHICGPKLWPRPRYLNGFPMLMCEKSRRQKAKEKWESLGRWIMKFELHRIVIETRVFCSSLRLVADIDEWKASWARWNAGHSARH